MKRRDFIKSALATGGVLGLSPHLLHGRVPSDAPVDPAVKRVLVMFKCHFDAGFIDTQANVVSWYFEQVLPQGDPNRSHPSATGERPLCLDHRLLADLPIP